MSHVHLTSGRGYPCISRVRAPFPTGDSVEQSPEAAAAPGVDPGPEPVHSEEVPAGLAAAALEKRAATMFSGTTGAPVASGESQAASEPTWALCRDAFAVVERLPAALFDKTALHRPCGLLDQYEAVGMLICDVLGMLLVPAGPIARAVGLKAFKNKEKIAAEVTKVRKAARRKGLDFEAAEAAVLGQAVQLPLPSAAERATAMRAQQPKPPSPAPTPDPTPAEPDKPPCSPSDERPDAVYGYERPDAVYGSVLAAKAVAAAHILEKYLPPGDPEEDEEREVARVKYMYALRRLAAEFPELKIPAGLHAGVDASRQETRPCPCGAGLLPRWPWVFQTVSLGFCPSNDVDWSKSTDDKATADRTDKHFWEMCTWRSEWIMAAPGGDCIGW